MARSFGVVGFPPDFKKKTSHLKLEEIGKTESKEYFYDQGYAFKIYKDQSGEVYEEFEAGCPWDGGPSLYLGLRKQKTKDVVCTWTPSQMGFSEDVELPEGVSEKDLQGFITEYDLPLIKGYCPLYCQIHEDFIELYQDVEGKCNPDHLYLKIQTKEGSKVRDWLSQQCFKIEEFTGSNVTITELREGYRDIYNQYKDS